MEQSPHLNKSLLLLLLLLLQRARSTVWHAAATIPLTLISTYRRRDEWVKRSVCQVVGQHTMRARRWSLHVSAASVSPLPSNWSQCEFAHHGIFMTHVWTWCWSLPIWLQHVHMSSASSSRGSNLSHQGRTLRREPQLLINGTWVSTLHKVIESPAR